MAEGGKQVVPVFFYESLECKRGDKTYMVHYGTKVDVVETTGDKDDAWMEAQATKQIQKLLVEEVQKWNADEKNDPKLIPEEFKRVKFGYSEDKQEAEHQLGLIQTAGLFKKLEKFDNFVPLQPSVWMTFPKDVKVKEDGTQVLDFGGIKLCAVDGTPGSRSPNPPDFNVDDLPRTHPHLVSMALAIGRAFGFPDPKGMNVVDVSPQHPPNSVMNFNAVFEEDKPTSDTPEENVADNREKTFDP